MTTLITGGIVFDGSGSEGRTADVLVDDDGLIEAIDVGLSAPEGAERIDADGCWVTPGFLDLHTHYDAEMEIAPALGESLRHGVTTVLVGSCGLSMVAGEPEDLADMFCRVEGIPRSTVLPLLEEIVDWESPAGYVEHLNTLPLGPNVVGMAGHSTLRADAMGLHRSVSDGVEPTAEEMAAMRHLVDESIDAGLLGLSVNLLPWDKMGGTRVRSRPTPSVFGTFREYRELADIVRRRGALFQAIPNLQTRWSIFPLLDMSRPRRGRPLRTSLLTLMDASPAMGAYRIMATLAQSYNDRMGANVHFQALPTPFDLYTDGLENPVIEEFGAGTEALHLEDPEARRALLTAPVYRTRFRRQWRNKVASRAYHRDLTEARIISCPEEGLAGRTFAEVGAERGVDALDAFLDLQIRYGNDLRWYTVVANADAEHLNWIMDHPAAVIGFSDAGAHLRNMAFYNYPLRMLKRVRDAQNAGRPFMTVGRAVSRLTAEIADHLGVDAGRLDVGARADVVIIDPERLDATVEDITEEDMVGFEGLRRLVRRNDDTVRAVIVNGRTAWSGGAFAPDVGSSRGYGRFLPLASSAG